MIYKSDYGNARCIHKSMAIFIHSIEIEISVKIGLSYISYFSANYFHCNHVDKIQWLYVNLRKLFYSVS